MRPLWAFAFVFSLAIFAIDAQVGGAGLLVFGVLYAISGRVDSQIENVGPSVGSFASTGCLILAIGFLAIVVLFVLGGGGEVSR